MFETSLCGNKELLLCSIVIVLIQVAFIQIDPINNFFDAQALEYTEIVYLLLYSSLVLIIMDSMKLVFRVCRLSTAKRFLEYFRTRELKLVD